MRTAARPFAAMVVSSLVALAGAGPLAGCGDSGSAVDAPLADAAHADAATGDGALPVDFAVPGDAPPGATDFAGSDTAALDGPALDGPALDGTTLDGTTPADARTDALAADAAPADAAPADAAPADAAPADAALDAAVPVDARADSALADATLSSDLAAPVDAQLSDAAVVADLVAAIDARADLASVDLGAPADGGCVPALPPDTGYATRAAAALAHVGPMLVPNRDYFPSGATKPNCTAFSDDGHGLVARLELDARGLSGGATPAMAEPWAAWIAQQLTMYLGTSTAPGPCRFSVSGTPSPMQAASAVAYALRRYGGNWSTSTKNAIAAMARANGGSAVYFANGAVDVPAAELLAGDAIGDATLLAQGKADLDSIYTQTVAAGGHEMNAPLYTVEHFPALAFLQSLSTQSATTQAAMTEARILMDYELLVEAHLYQPSTSGSSTGGVFAAPKARDYSGGDGDGGRQSMLPLVWLLTGDPSTPSSIINTAYSYVIVAATQYKLPPIIRSIFLDKGAGYTFWAFHDEGQGAARMPRVIYPFGLNNAQVSPWQEVMLAGGAGSLGVAHGYNNQPTSVSSGAILRAPSGAFAWLYHYEPEVTGDSDDTGAALGGTGLNSNPDDFLSELYDYEHLVYGRTALTLWDPIRADDSKIVRTTKDTRAHVPDYASLGGQVTTVPAKGTSFTWHAAQLGTAYVAWLPLVGAGASITTQAKVDSHGASFTEYTLPGLSGSVTEIADTSDFPSLAAYAADLAGRYVSFTTTPTFAGEVDARDPKSGQLVRIRLVYPAAGSNTATRVVGGASYTPQQALDHGLMSSLWVSWDATTERLTTARACYAGDVYDWKAVSITGP